MMKKSLIALTLIGTMIIGAQSITFAQDTTGEQGKDTQVESTLETSEETTVNENCPYGEEGQGYCNNGENSENPNCDGTAKRLRLRDGSGNGEGKRQGKGQGRGACMATDTVETN